MLVISQSYCSTYMMQYKVTLYQLYYNNEKRKRAHKVENYTNEESSEELHNEEPEESEDDDPPHALLLMHTLNLFKVMMMKVAHQIWTISMAMEVRKKKKLDR
jgi:hypothetical protein